MSLTPIADFVRDYAASDTSRLHMPGHKGRGPLGCEGLDITEIAGADELYEAEGIIAQSEANTARLFGSAGSWYGTEGSSQCIRAMVFLALQAAPKGQGRPVLLAARNAHKALLYAAALLDIDVEWLWPPAGPDASLCACPVGPAALSAALDNLDRAGRRPFGVYLTSPDYLGGIQDISALAPVCHDRGIPLLVDNAHGAYLRFLPGGSRHPLDLGADLCCDSAHKTLPVLTGGACLHARRGGLLQPGPAAVRGAMCLFGSTSPSYLILQSLDLCAGALAGDWPARLADCIARLDALKERLSALCPGFVRPCEPLKLVLDGAAAGRSGSALADLFRAHRVECEYADTRYLVLMFTPDNLPRDFARVEEAAREAVAHPGREQDPGVLPDGLWTDLARQARPACTIRQAVFAPQERVPAREAVGRVCALPTVACPPAIPIAVSGEVIGPAAAALLEAYGVKTVSAVLF